MKQGTSTATDGVILYKFDHAAQLWFWFMKSLEAREQGALCGGANSETPRPCEPNDVYQIINRLYRKRRLLIDHFRVLSHYGKRGYAPDQYRRREQKAHTLWHEAMKILTPIFEEKGFLKPRLRLVHSDS